MSDQTASLGTVDEQIAALFAEEEVDQEKELGNDLEEDDTQPEESNDDEGEESTEEAEEEQPEEEVTWSKLLNVDDDKITVDDDGNLIGVNVKVDGKVETVDMSELIAGYQTSKSYTQKTQALAEQRKEFESVREAVSQDYMKKIEDAQALNVYLQKSLMKDYQSIDWQELRRTNPAEYAATIQDYQLKIGEVEKVSAAIKQEMELEKQRLAQENSNKTNEFLSSQVEALLAKVPEWRDSNKFKADLSTYRDFMANEYGIPGEQFDQIGLAGAIEAIRDLMKYKQGTHVAEKKLLKAVPKFQKATGKVVKTVSKTDKLAEAARNATGRKKLELQTSAIEALLNG